MAAGLVAFTLGEGLLLSLRSVGVARAATAVPGAVALVGAALGVATGVAVGFILGVEFERATSLVEGDGTGVTGASLAVELRRGAELAVVASEGGVCGLGSALGVAAATALSVD